MKKICFITTVPITIKVFLLKTIEYLHQNTNWEIHMICSNDDNFEDALPEYIHYHPIQMARGISLGGIKAMFEMRKIFKREKFDLIQYSTPNASLYAALAGTLAGVPVRLYCQWGIAYVGFSGLKKKIFKLVEKWVCQMSTWIEPDSHSNLSFAHAEGLYKQKKSSVIGNGSACGVNLEKFDVSHKEEYRKKIKMQYNIADDDFVFGFVGRVTRDKGVNELLCAFQNIYKEYPNSYLMLVGPDECDETVDEPLFRWSKACDNVIYTGYTNVVEQYLSAMDIYILPSYREGFGMGVIEAEAMRVPVIVTDIPGPTDAMLNGETGIVIEKKSVAELEQAMRTMMNDKDFLKKCSLNARELVEEKFEQQQLFGEVLKDRKRLMKVEG